MASREPIVAFLKLEKEKTKQLEAVLRTSMKDIDAELARIAGSDRAAKLTRAQLMAQKAAIKGYLDSGFDDVQKIVGEGQREAARRASDVISKEFEPLLKGVATGEQLQALAASEAERAANGVNAAMKRLDSSYKPLSARVYGTQNIANGFVDEIINRGLVQGWSAARLASEVRSSIDPATPGGVSYAAKRLARTEINNAFHASTVARYKEAKFVDGVDWNLSTSHPEGDRCDELKDGSPYDVNEVPEKPHPQCFCYITAALPSPDDFLENLFSGKYDEPGEFDETPTNQIVAEVPKVKVKTTAPKPPKVETKTTLEELRGLRDDPKKFAQAIGRQLNGRYGALDLEMVSAGKYASFGSKTIAQGNIIDPVSKKIVGKLEREFTFKPDGTISVDNRLIQIKDKEFRGKGFASNFYRESEQWLKSEGVTEVTVHAALEDGAYTWSKAGFRWAQDPMNRDPSSTFVTTTDKRMQATIKKLGTKADAELRERVENLYDRMKNLPFDDPAYPQPWEIVSMQGTSSKLNGMNIGEYLMRTTDWYGVKNL